MPLKVNKILTVIMTVSIALFTSGCWDSLNIEDREIITAVVLDKTDEGYIFFTEIPAITAIMKSQQSESAGGEQLNTYIVIGSGKSLIEARADQEKKVNKAIFLGAVQSMIVTQRMAEYGIGEYVNRVRYINEYRKTMDVFVTPDNPEDLLRTKPENVSGIGFAIEQTIKNLYDHGLTFHVSLQDLLEKLSSRNSCYLLLTISGESEQITLTGYTVFDGDKSIGFLPYEQSRGVVYFASDDSDRAAFNYSVPLENNRVTVEVKLKGRKIRADYVQGKISFNIDMTYKGLILYSSGDTPITEQAEQEIKNKLQETICDELLTAIDTSRQDFGCDYLSFSEYFRIRHPDEFEQIDWDNEFPNAEFSINVAVDVEMDPSLDYNPKEVK